MINTRFGVTVSRVVDGDTFYSEPITFDFGDYELTIKNPKFRLLGIDTPEKHQPGYQEATDFSRNTLEGRSVTVDVVGKDVFDRFLVVVFLLGEDEKSVNDMLLENGLAVKYPRKRS